MKVKVMSPLTGEIQRTSSIGKFNSGGQQFSVKDNLLAGEEDKYQKMIGKKPGPTTPTQITQTVPGANEVPHGDEIPKKQEIARLPKKEKPAQAPIKGKRQPPKGEVKQQVKPQEAEKEDKSGWWY